MTTKKYVLFLLALFSICTAGVSAQKSATDKVRELGIYNLPPFERAILCTKFYDYDK